MSKVNATYGLTQSPLVMSTAGRVGVGLGVAVDVGGGVLVEVGLGEGWGMVVDICAFDPQAVNINELRKIK
jgi:hypothetical protein